jgi:hypothetical protein
MALILRSNSFDRVFQPGSKSWVEIFGEPPLDGPSDWESKPQVETFGEPPLDGPSDKESKPQGEEFGEPPLDGPSDKESKPQGEEFEEPPLDGPSDKESKPQGEEFWQPPSTPRENGGFREPVFMYSPENFYSKGPEDRRGAYASFCILDPLITVERHYGNYHVAARFNLETTILGYNIRKRLDS